MNDTTKPVPTTVNPATETEKKAPAVVAEADFGEGVGKVQFVADEKTGEWEYGAVNHKQKTIITLRAIANLFQQGTDAAVDGAFNYVKGVANKIVSAAYNSATKEGATNLEAFIKGITVAVIPPKSVTISTLKDDIEEENKKLGALSLASQFLSGVDRVNAAIAIGIKTVKEDGSPLDDESLKANIQNTFIATANRVIQKQVTLGAMMAKAAQAKAKKATPAPAPVAQPA